MAAVLQLDPAQVAEACAEAATETGLVVQAANLNSPGQTVISGAAAAVEKASALCKAKGARRAVTLPVSAPFHCALMQPAQDEVARVLAALSLHDPQIPVAANVTGSLVKALVGSGPEVFVEVGPGKVLSGLMKQIDPAQKALNVEDFASLEKTLAELQ